MSNRTTFHTDPAIRIPKISDPRGNLSFVENATHLPFDIASVEWVCGSVTPDSRDFPSGAAVGLSSECEHLVVALSGSVVIDRTSSKGHIDSSELSRPDEGLLCRRGESVSLHQLSSGAVVMILSSADSAPKEEEMCVDSTASGPEAHADSSIEQCYMFDVPSVHSAPRVARLDNSLSPMPFDVRRVFYIYDTPEGAARGGHSHHTELCVLVALNGSLDITVDDGRGSRCFSLNSPDKALFVPPGIWRTLDNFSEGCVVMALSSIRFDESDYVRSFHEFNLLTAHKRQCQP